MDKVQVWSLIFPKSNGKQDSNRKHTDFLSATDFKKAPLRAFCRLHIFANSFIMKR
jgi:hypothetical protein